MPSGEIGRRASFEGLVFARTQVRFLSTGCNKSLAALQLRFFALLFVYHFISM